MRIRKSFLHGNEDLPSQDELNNDTVWFVAQSDSVTVETISDSLESLR